MPTATIKFKLPSEQYEYYSATKGCDALAALWDIQQELFRPARKHGYSQPKLNALLESGEGRDGILEAIGILEDMFRDILNEHDINIDK